MPTIVCCGPGGGPWWTLQVVLNLFALVIVVSFFLIRHFNERDRRIRDEFVEARRRFMDAVSRFQDGPACKLLFMSIIVLDVQAIMAYHHARQVTPDLQPDADWLNSIQWVDLKCRSSR